MGTTIATRSSHGRWTSRSTMSLVRIGIHRVIGLTPGIGDRESHCHEACMGRFSGRANKGWPWSILTSEQCAEVLAEKKDVRHYGHYRTMEGEPAYRKDATSQQKRLECRPSSTENVCTQSPSREDFVRCRC